jgi:uncharacterized paraquat-inducible protein A
MSKHQSFRQTAKRGGMVKLADRWVYDLTRYCIGCNAVLAERETICGRCHDELISLNERQEQFRVAAEGGR